MVQNRLKVANACARVIPGDLPAQPHGSTGIKLVPSRLSPVNTKGNMLQRSQLLPIRARLQERHSRGGFSPVSFPLHFLCYQHRIPPGQVRLPRTRRSRPLQAPLRHQAAALPGASLRAAPVSPALPSCAIRPGSLYRCPEKHQASTSSEAEVYPAPGSGGIRQILATAF